MVASVLNWLLEASLALGLVVVLILLARRIWRDVLGARWIYALWLAVPATLITTLAPADLIALPIGPPAAVAPAPVIQPESPASAPASAVTAHLLEAFPTDPEEARLAPEATPPRIKAQQAILAAWLIGLASALFASARTQQRFHRTVVARARRPTEHERLALGAAATGAPFVADRDFRFSRNLVSPVAHGALRPLVLLPEDFLTHYSSAERHVALLHEAEHVRARHIPHRLIARLLRAAFWFHPLIWLAEREFAADQEIACDEGALARDPSIRPSAYASTLLKTAERLTQRSLGAPATSIALVTRRHLTERTKMLARRLPQKKTRLSGLSALGVVATLGALAGCVSITPGLPASDPDWFDALEVGQTRRAEITAMAGEPDYVMPRLSVAVYDSDERRRPVFVGCKTYVGQPSGRPLHVVKYDDDQVVESAWATSGDLIELPSDDFDLWTQRARVRPDEQPPFATLEPGATPRAELEAIVGEPYYVMPRHNVAVYATEPTPNEAAFGCGIGPGAVSIPLRHVIQYNDDGVATRAETIVPHAYPERIDVWAAKTSGEPTSVAFTEARDALHGLQAQLDGEAQGDAVLTEAEKQLQGILDTFDFVYTDDGVSFGESLQGARRAGRTWFLRTPDGASVFVRATRRDPSLAGVLIEDARAADQPMIFVARSAALSGTPEDRVLTMRDGSILSPDGRSVLRFDAYQYSLGAAEIDDSLAETLGG